LKYPDTYYSSTAITTSERKALTEDITADVCIIGAGIAGLSCALELLENGKSVIILEKESVAWGASGRNGGLVSPGWAQDLTTLETKLGLEKSKALFDLSLKGVDIIKQNIANYELTNCDLKVGELQAARYPQYNKLKKKMDSLSDNYQYQLTLLETDEVRDICHTSRYHEGLFSDTAFHFHPLNYCLGLAEIIEQKGGQIFEQTAVLKVSKDADQQLVCTQTSKVICDQVVFCGGGYSGEEIPELYQAFLPISTYMVLTEPLGDLANQLITKAYSIKDDRQAADYYRLVEGDRLLWGSRITTNKNANHQHLSTLLREDMVSVYPQLEDVEITKSWSGLMAYARHKMPIVREHRKGQWICSSFGGHGLNTGTICGGIVAQAICELNDDFEIFSPFGCDWNGGIFGPIAANVIYKYLRITDRYQESKFHP